MQFDILLIQCVKLICCTQSLHLLLISSLCQAKITIHYKYKTTINTHISKIYSSKRKMQKINIISKCMNSN